MTDEKAKFWEFWKWRRSTKIIAGMAFVWVAIFNVFYCYECEGTGKYVVESTINLSMYADGVSRKTAIEDAIDAGLSRGACRECGGDTW